MLTGQEAMILQSYNCKEVARDVSWHPHYPVLASTSFNGQIDQWTLQNVDKNSTKKLFSQQDYAHMAGRGIHAGNDDSEEDEDIP